MNPIAARAMYRRQLQAHGETITLRRIVPNESTLEATALAKVTGYTPDELVGGIIQGDQRAIVLAEDVAAGAIPLPLKTGDKLVYMGRVLNVQFLALRRVAGETIAYDITARG